MSIKKDPPHSIKTDPPTARAELNALYDLLGVFQPKAGLYYPSIQIHYGRGGLTWADYPANILTASYYPIFRKIRADRIGISILGAGGAGALIRLGIYDDKDFYPDSLVVDAGEVSVETTGFKTLVIDEVLDVGRYWLAFVLNDPTVDLARHSVLLPAQYVTSITSVGTYFISQTYGALPSSFPSGASVRAGLFHQRLRVAEVY